MTKLELLSAGLVAAAMLATPAMARQGHVTSRHLAAAPRPPRVTLTAVFATWLPASAHLQHSPGTTATSLASPAQVIDPPTSQSRLTIRRCQATNPGRYRFGLGGDVTAPRRRAGNEILPARLVHCAVISSSYPRTRKAGPTDIRTQTGAKAKEFFRAAVGSGQYEASLGQRNDRQKELI